MTPNPVPTGEAVRYGWERMKERLGFWIVLMLIIGAVSYLPQALGQQFIQSAPTMTFVINLIGWVLSIFVSIGAITISLMVYDGQAPTYADLFSRRELFFRYLWGTILYGLITTLGFLLLIVPGFIFLVRYQFVPYLIVDRRLGATEALSMSARLTDGMKWRLFVFDLALIGVTILGLLALGVGLLIASPVVLIAGAYMYRYRFAATSGAAGMQPAPVTI